MATKLLVIIRENDDFPMQGRYPDPLLYDIEVPEETDEVIHRAVAEERDRDLGAVGEPNIFHDDRKITIEDLIDGIDLIVALAVKDGEIVVAHDWRY